MTRSYDDMFRPAYEMPASLSWAAAALGLCISQPPLWPVFSVGALALALSRMKQAGELYKFRLSIVAGRAEKITANQAMSIARRHINRSDGFFWIGRGFKWTQKHAEVSRRIMFRSPGEIETFPQWLPLAIQRHLEPANYVPLKEDAIGVPWIHGIEPEEVELSIPIDALAGHTLIVGTTRAGKTRLYELLSTQIIHCGKVLIVLDPKGDKDWENRLRKECKRTKRKFLYFHPAYPSRSIRINPIAAWNNLSEPATRVSQLVDAEGTFGAFAWKTLYRIMRGIVADGEKPTIKAAKQYVQRGVESLLERLISKAIFELQGAKWDQDLTSFTPDTQKGKQSPIQSVRLAQLIAKYQSLDLAHEAIESLISMVYHNREHYTKMIQVLEPLLEMLGSDELGDLLSPDPLDLDDKRPIYDIKKVIEEDAVLYVGLDSLSNKIIGSAIGSILLADIASEAGAIYNFRDKKDIYLLVDEAAEVINEQGIQILNKGGGAGVKAFIATQTTADFDAVFGSEARTNQALGNLNNVLCLRVKDRGMAEWIAKSFGETSARNINYSQSTGSGSSSTFTEFSGSNSQTISEVAIPLVSPDLLTRLPGLQYFAFVAGSTLYKGRLPLLDGSR